MVNGDPFRFVIGLDLGFVFGGFVVGRVVEQVMFFRGDAPRWGADYGYL